MNLHETIAVPAAQKVATATAAGGLGAAAYFGITSQEFGMFIGLFIAFGGGVTAALINFYFRQKHFKLVEAYVRSGEFDRRRTDRRGDVCSQCPLVKHRHDCDVS